jgi:hypothetical protein
MKRSAVPHLRGKSKAAEIIGPGEFYINRLIFNKI